MSKAKKLYLLISCSVIALGIVLAFIGFAASGWNSDIFTASIQDGVITLGGTRVEDPSVLPFAFADKISGQEHTVIDFSF